MVSAATCKVNSLGLLIVEQTRCLLDQCYLRGPQRFTIHTDTVCVYYLWLYAADRCI